MTHRGIPPGFVEVRQDRRDRQTWWVRQEWASVLPNLLATPDLVNQQATPVVTLGGRGDIRRLPLADGVQAMIRQYRRGGFMRHFVHDLYWGQPFRPFSELLCIEEARRRGVPTIEALAAGVTTLGGGFYRGVFISREAVGYVNLWEWLQQRPAPPAREAVLATVAQAIHRMHDAGIFHADLNLTNILVGADTSRPDARIIDFDRGRIYSGPLSQSLREKNLQRLQRSLRKLDREEAFTTSADEEAFCRAYSLFGARDSCSGVVIE